ncbi:MAG: PAS domain-containing protein [Anaerolineaceae bacterium]|nr:PAS domain-containing protein [Anaerolineaceae bacterium]
MQPEIPVERLLESRTHELRDDSTFLSTATDSQPSGFLLIHQGLIKHADNSAFQLLGCSPEDLIDQPLIHFKAEPGRSELEISVNNQIKRIEINTSEIQLGDETNLLISMQDITWRNQSEDRLNLALEATGLGLWDYDFKTNTTSVNTYYATMIGYTVEEFDPGMWIKLVHPIDLNPVWDAWNKHIDNQSPSYTQEYRILTKSGDWKWVSARGKIKEHDVDGKPLHYIGTHQDITRQKQAEQQLKLLYHITAISSDISNFAEQMQKILEKILEVIGFPMGMIHVLSEGEKQLTLVSSQGFQNKVFKHLKKSPLQNNFWETVIQNCEITQLPENFASLGYTDLQKAGVIMGAGFPICLQEDTIGVLSVFGNEAQPLTNLEIHLLQVAAKQLSAAIERNQLRQLSERAVLFEERQRLARELHDSLSQTLYSLTLVADGGRDFARIGDLERVEQIFDQVSEIVSQTLKEMRLLVYELRPAMLAQEGLEGALRRRLEMVEERARMQTSFHVNLQSDISQSLEAELYGIAQEALNNVLKHSGASQIQVNLFEEANNIILRINDNGLGFDTDSNSTAGIGLLSIRERAARINGKVTISSAVGQGTTVRIIVPDTDH